MGVAKTASKEIFCYARNFFLTVKKCVQEVFARLGKKFYARSVHLEPAPGVSDNRTVIVNKPSV